MNTNHRYPIVYGAYAKDEHIILNSSSGGMFTLIVNWFLQEYNNNCMVAGVIWDDDFKGAHYVLSNKLDVIKKMRGSKYIQSKKNDIFTTIEKKLKSGKYILFIGCPCEVAALKKYLNKEYNELFTVDFMCKGALSPKVMEQYVDDIEKKYKLTIKDINMRYKWEKMDTWIPQFIKIDLDNGKSIIKEFYNTELGHAFRIMQRPACYDCKFMENNKVADITIGDFHGVKKQMKFYNPKGTSTLFINDEKGEVIFNCISNNMIYDIADAAYIYENNKGFKDLQRDKFGKIIASKGLHMAIKECLTVKDRIKLILPTKFVRYISSLKRGKIE